MLRSCFSPDYFAARRRFRAAAAVAGLRLQSHPLARATQQAQQPGADPLTIDVALSNNEAATRALVVSSGVHGVEGFFGSAVQLAMLAALRAGDVTIGDDARIVLIHAVNPYGFAKLRRWNEDGVDLNRNFLRPGEAFAGSPPLYSQIDPWLNPHSPPRRGLGLPPRAIIDLLRFGAGRLMQTIPVGQYDNPRGLFYGGSEPAESTRVVQQHLGEWIADAQAITHLDFHTGLGRFATHKLLLDVARDHPHAAWFGVRFGREAIATLPGKEGNEHQANVYSARGALGPWCMSRFAEREYRFATAEFGTYSATAVLLALRQENRAHHWAGGAARYAWTQRRLLEMFAPANFRWRERVVADGLQILRRSGNIRSGSESSRRDEVMQPVDPIASDGRRHAGGEVKRS